MKKSIADLSSRRERIAKVPEPRGQRAAATMRVAETRRGWVGDDRASFWFAAIVWVSVIYLTVPSNYYSLSVAELTEMTEPNPIFRAIKLVLIGVSIAIILWRGSLAWLLLQGVNRPFLFCMALMPLSVAWSIDSSATIAREVSIASVAFVCYAFTLGGWHPRRFQSVVRPVVTALLAGSIIFGLLYPDLAIETGEGTLKNAWRGLTYQKNQLGIVASIGTIFWLHALFTREVKRTMAFIGLVISGACLLLSRSSTSLLSTLMATGLMLVLLFLPGRMRRFAPYIVGTFSTIVVVYAIAVLNVVPGLDVLITPITDLFGKDTTFSNRSWIWSIMKEFIDQRPLLGSGFGAFWTGPVPSSASYEFVVRMNFYPSEAHNGYLDVVNSLGFVGLVALLGYLATYVRHALRLMRAERSQAILYLCLFFQQAVGNLSESYWLQTGFGFTIMTLATLCIARALLDQKLQAVFGQRDGMIPVARR